MATALTINGKTFQLSHLRRSRKGAQVFGGRFHVDGVGTVYVQAYEPLKSPPKGKPRVKVTSDETSAQIGMMLEIIKAFGQRIEQVEDKLTTPPASPPAQNAHH